MGEEMSGEKRFLERSAKMLAVIPRVDNVN